MVQRPRPMIRKLPEPVHAGNWAFGHADVVAPSPLERNPLSPKGWKNRESDGIGLGIVAALEKNGGEGSRKLVVGAPVVIISPRTRAKRGWVVDDDELGCSGRCSAGSVCCGGGDHGAKGGEDLRWREMGRFCGSTRSVLDLSYCYLCRKRLDGQDIYMYRGEKAFCSMECRYRQIVSDEYQEKCGSEASKPSDVASSTYSGGQLFFTGIAAA